MSLLDRRPCKIPLILAVDEVLPCSACECRSAGSCLGCRTGDGPGCSEANEGERQECEHDVLLMMVRGKRKVEGTRTEGTEEEGTRGRKLVRQVRQSEAFASREGLVRPSMYFELCCLAGSK